MTPAETTPHSSTVWRRFRLSRVGIAIAVVAFLVLGGTGAYAFWAVTTSMKFSTSVQTGTLMIATSWSQSSAMEYTNEPASLRQMMYFTVKNTTANNNTARDYDAALNYSAATAALNPVESDLTLTIWKAATPTTDCGTVPPTTGTTVTKWNNSPIEVSGILGAPGATTNPGDTDKWCIYSSVAERSSLASAAGAVQLTPNVTATLKAGTWTGTSATPGSGPVQRTKAIFLQEVWVSGARLIQGSNGFCLDVSQESGSGKNVKVLQYACTSSKAHQQWNASLVGLSGDDAKYVVFSPVSPTGKQLAGPTPITVQNSGTGYEQQWQIQERRAGVYQLVNRMTGLCLNRPNNVQEAQLTTGSCDDQIEFQDFTFGPVIEKDLKCEDRTGTIGWKWDHNRYSWGTPSADGDRIAFVRRNSGDEPVYHEIPAGSTEFTIWEKGQGTPQFDPGRNGQYHVYVQNTSGVTYLDGRLVTSSPIINPDPGSWLDCKW